MHFVFNSEQFYWDCFEYLKCDCLDFSNRACSLILAFPLQICIFFPIYVLFPFRLVFIISVVTVLNWFVPLEWYSPFRFVCHRPSLVCLVRRFVIVLSENNRSVRLQFSHILVFPYKNGMSLSDCQLTFILHCQKMVSYLMLLFYFNNSPICMLYRFSIRCVCGVNHTRLFVQTAHIIFDDIQFHTHNTDLRRRLP